MKKWWSAAAVLVSLLLMSLGMTVCAAESTILKGPFMLLTTKSESVWGQYEVAKVGNSYVLKAKNPGQVVSIKLEFQGDLVSDLYVQLKDGNTNRYTLSQVKTQVSDSSFEYKIPEDAQIDDERKSN